MLKGQTHRYGTVKLGLDRVPLPLSLLPRFGTSESLLCKAQREGLLWVGGLFRRALWEEETQWLVFAHPNQSFINTHTGAPGDGFAVPFDPGPYG